MNPIETTRKISSDYQNYLKSILTVKDGELTEKAFGALEKSKFVKGPYLEATPPYLQGQNLSSLMDEGIANRDFEKLAPQTDVMRPLYTHQESAFKKIVVEKRNIVVATGTGSGKTESFMYPVFNHLMNEISSGRICDGVRALFLYPMNALANDQMKRLRELLANYPEITFGRYTGETLQTEAKAKEAYVAKREQEIRSKNKFAVRGVDYSYEDLLPLPNERISREAMRANPPHILLTNYAMLEFLLITPRDNVFFNGNNGKHWKFIVLDEAHTYKGANGTEIALLLRRLKERVCQNERGIIQCIATSATLGDQDALPALANFASDIFDEHFEVSDIVTSQRVKRVYEDDLVRGLITDYESFKRQVTNMEESEAGRYLYDELIKDIRIIDIFKNLEQKPKDINDVAQAVFSDYEDESMKIKGLILLIELGVRAKKNKDTAALLPARYHLFIRALEGVYVSLYPQRQVFLDRKEQVTIAWDQKVPVFELANCQNCGQEYLIGREKEGKLMPPLEEELPQYFLLTNEVIDSEEISIDDDDQIIEKAGVKSIEAQDLCTACGSIVSANQKQKANCCDCSDPKKIIRVYKMASKGREPNTCASCGSVSSAVIKRFMTANQPATYVIANSLYAMILPQKIEINPEAVKNTGFFGLKDTARNQEFYDESGRKLLAFSDNRQEAAFFAAYMDNKYNQLMWRRLILNELRKKPNGVVIGDMIPLLYNAAKSAGLYPSDEVMTEQDKKNIAWTYLIKEFLGFERRQGLEGKGYVRFFPEPMTVPSGRWNFSATELWETISILMDTLRYSGAMNYPETIDPTGDEFSPKNREVFFRQENGEKESNRFISFLPVGKTNNKRFDFIKKVLLNEGVEAAELPERSKEILRDFYSLFLELQNAHYILQGKTRPTDGVLYTLNFQKWKIAYVDDSDIIYQCNRCGKIATHNIRDICPEFRCSGKLEEIKAEDFRQDPYYANIYQDEKIIPMISKEHTAQLDKEAAGDIQKKFESGQVNVLSCSTTFEMGVDVGQLEAIFLRNVPPETSNYIQRAGRAGRRTSATAFSVTYARRNSHDLNYFANPPEIISGKIRAPYIELKNDKIALRHVNSIVVAWFFRKNEAYFDEKVLAITGANGMDNAAIALKMELDKKPQDLIESIKCVLTPYLFERLGIDNWDFADKIVGENGSLTNAIAQTLSDKESLLEIIRDRENAALKKHARPYTEDINRHLNTINSRQSISYLASGGVLPKYGFPVDVVKLDIFNNSAEAATVDLSRDLKLAISEYAPGSEIIAGGRIWTSYSINKVRDKEWPTYHYYECNDCKRTLIPEGMTTLEEDNDHEEVEICTCGKKMKAHKFIIPIFGFSTKIDDKPKRVGERRPKRFYSTKVQFGGFEKLDTLQEKEQSFTEIAIADRVIRSMYSPQGKLILLNKGGGKSGFFVCKSCGYACDTPQRFTNHKNRSGKSCGNNSYRVVALGHIFNSDIVKLEFPKYDVQQFEYGDLWTSLLYAILEGASDALGISRSDINGCVDRSGLNPALILFDEAAGGAGHVKQIANKLDMVLRAALERVSGKCGCGEETSCYGCLRGYSNQFDHDFISRGSAKVYLEWILMNRIGSGVTYRNISEIEFSSAPVTKSSESNIAVSDITQEWKKALQWLLDPTSAKAYELAIKLIEKGVKDVPIIGYELSSDEQGVLGYEAEMAWTEKRVAILVDDSSEAAMAFDAAGWSVYVIGMVDLEALIKQLC